MHLRYKEQNIKCTESYKRYDSRIPKYLHNRPKGVVTHIMKRIDAGIGNENIAQVTPRLFNVKGSSSQETYQVWLGSESHLPSCQCLDYKMKKLPCKHICAVVQQPGIGWESLGSKFGDHPLFTLDPVVTRPTVINSPSKEDQLNPSSDNLITVETGSINKETNTMGECPNLEAEHDSAWQNEVGKVKLATRKTVQYSKAVYSSSEVST